MVRKKNLLMYWAGKGHNVAIISAKMESYFGPSAPSQFWVTQWLRELKRGEDVFEPYEHSGRPQDPLTGLRILEFLNSTPFVSIHQIASATKIPRSTVSDRSKGWGYVVRHLKWVFHRLTTAMMEQRVELSQELLVTLRPAKCRGWAHFLTGDESWFWLTIDDEQQWLLPHAESPTRTRKMVRSLKAMLIIFWSPLSFSVIQVLPPNVTFTSEFFIDAILPHIVAAKPAGNLGRRLVLHMDNASPHGARLTARNLEESQITASPHPAFAPDFAPSDFFLFGVLRSQLNSRIFESPDELVQAIREIANAIPRTTLERVFLEWEKRLQ
jgi:hypothetical protein